MDERIILPANQIINILSSKHLDSCIIAKNDLAIDMNENRIRTDLRELPLPEFTLCKRINRALLLTEIAHHHQGGRLVFPYDGRAAPFGREDRAVKAFAMHENRFRISRRAQLGMPLKNHAQVGLVHHVPGHPPQEVGQGARGEHVDCGLVCPENFAIPVDVECIGDKRCDFPFAQLEFRQPILSLNLGHHVARHEKDTENRTIRMLERTDTQGNPDTTAILVHSVNQSRGHGLARKGPREQFDRIDGVFGRREERDVLAQCFRKAVAEQGFRPRIPEGQFSIGRKNDNRILDMLERRRESGEGINRL